MINFVTRYEVQALLSTKLYPDSPEHSFWASIDMVNDKPFEDIEEALELADLHRRAHCVVTRVVTTQVAVRPEQVRVASWEVEAPTSLHDKQETALSADPNRAGLFRALQIIGQLKEGTRFNEVALAAIRDIEISIRAEIANGGPTTSGFTDR